MPRARSAQPLGGRAADFFGPGVRQSALGERVWPALLAGKPVAWFGDPDAERSFPYVPDFAAALVRLSREERASGRAWHVPSPPPIAPRALLARAATLAGAPPPRVRRTPALLLRAVGLIAPAAGEMVEMGYLFDRPCVMSSRAYAETFGDAATNLDAALSATIDWQGLQGLSRASRAAAAAADARQRLGRDPEVARDQVLRHAARDLRPARDEGAVALVRAAGEEAGGAALRSDQRRLDHQPPEALGRGVLGVGGPERGARQPQGFAALERLDRLVAAAPETKLATSVIIAPASKNCPVRSDPSASR